MPSSQNSTVTIYTNAKPWAFIPPPASTHVQIYDQNQISNYQMKNRDRSSMTPRRCLLALVCGLLMFLLLCVAVVTPLVTALNSVSDEATTTNTTTSATTTTTSTNSTTTTASSLRWNATGTTIAGILNCSTATPTCLNLPIGIWLDSSDTIYVADASNARIQRFVSGNLTGTTIAGNHNGLAGSNASLLNYSNDAILDSSGNIYVVDTYNNRVQLWSANATAGVTIAGTGTAGNSNTTLNWPRNIVFGSNPNTYYISDASNNRIMQFTLNSTVGTLVAGGNGAGTNITQLNSPRGMYFDSSTNSLIIANSGANNIVRWVIGASSWTLVAGSINGVVGNGSTALNSPWDVKLDSMGNVYVADRYNERIQFFAAGQTNATTIAGTTGVSGTGAGQLNGPLSVALDSQMNLIVVDSFNNRVQKFFRY